jgi:hypothetical protein
VYVRSVGVKEDDFGDFLCDEFQRDLFSLSLGFELGDVGFDRLGDGSVVETVVQEVVPFGFVVDVGSDRESAHEGLFLSRSLPVIDVETSAT